MYETESSRCISFFEGLSTRLNTLAELREVYDEQMAFNFNATRFFGPNENKTSEILAFLLNPDSNHGQKSAFLRVFCDAFLPGDRERWDALINEGVDVHKEYTIDERRRIDIVIVFGHRKFFVGIENKIKIGANDLENQLWDYSVYLKKNSDDNYCLFYLNPDGHDPSKDSITQQQRVELGDKLQIISYVDDIIPLLDKFIMVCKADKVTAFLRDFQSYLRPADSILKRDTE